MRNRSIGVGFGLLAFAALSACTVTMGSGPGMEPGQPVGNTIQAGCSYTGTQLPGDVGSVFSVACPANCMTGGLWGSDLYTADSAICKAGIHAGVVPVTGGVLTVRLELGQPAYRGSARNGIQSGDYGAYGKSFAIVGTPAPVAAGPVAPAPGPVVSHQVIQAGCSFNADNLRGEVGSRHTVSCPVNCFATGGTWGTDLYTADSTICRAGIHAGIVRNDIGGMVTVIIEPGQPAYRGSVRNTVQSSDFGSFRLSFRLERP